MRLPSIALLVLVVGSLAGCSTTSIPQLSPGLTLGPTTPGGIATPGEGPSSPPSAGPRSRGLAVLPAHHVLAGADIAGAFDLATDGSVIAWTSGTVDSDAPELWAFDPATDRSTMVYRSTVAGAILANLAVRHGSYAFAEVAPRADGSRTWRLVLIDRAGALHVLDANDLPPAIGGVLPMAAISDAGVLWATNHDAGNDVPGCELRYASLEQLGGRLLQAWPCDREELWYPRSDGRSFVYGTVEYGPAGTGDDRHVYVTSDADPTQSRRLDLDGEASLPDVRGDTVIWKTARRHLNMFSFGELVEHSLASAATKPVALLADGGGQLTMPTIGLAWYAAENADSSSVQAWDRSGVRAVQIDRLDPGDRGFFSGVRLSGSLLVWFYTSTTQGGGVREIRWLDVTGL